MKTATRFAGLIVLALGAFVSTAVWSKDPVNATLFGKTAIHGYDPVAYFTDGMPVMGKEEFQLEWMGAKWRFATAEHRELFQKSPESYAPRYGEIGRASGRDRA